MAEIPGLMMETGAEEKKDIICCIVYKRRSSEEYCANGGVVVHAFLKPSPRQSRRCGLGCQRNLWPRLLDRVLNSHSASLRATDST